MKPPLTLYKETDILYGEKAETTVKIVPVSWNNESIYAVDISEMTAEESTNFMAIMKEYAEYVEMQTRMRFNLGTWLSHSGYEMKDDLKWRVFENEKTSIS